jgi:hypothetical protein
MGYSYIINPKLNQMRQFRAPSLDFNLRTRSRERIGNATKLTLSDCTIMIPTVWIKRYAKGTDSHNVRISEYWASTIYRKIVDAGGNPKKYRSLMSINF